MMKILAETASNHNGDLKICKDLIDIAKKAGCDAVKFQKRDASDLVNKLPQLGKSTGYLSKNEHDINHKSKKFGTGISNSFNPHFCSANNDSLLL